MQGARRSALPTPAAGARLWPGVPGRPRYGRRASAQSRAPLADPTPQPSPPPSRSPQQWDRGGLLAVWLQIAGVCALIGVVMTVSGAFGSDRLHVVPRFLFWMMQMTVGASVGVLVTRFVIPDAWFRVGGYRGYWVALPIALGTALPMSVLVAAMESLARRQAFRLGLVADVFPTTLVTSLAITALALIIRRRGPTHTHAAPAGAPAPKFLGRLPDKLKGAEVWAVEAQDHYLRLHTSAGQDLILMRLSDAIAELEGIEGAQTHRSWWVARAAVTETERAEGRAILTLKDGSKIPVSRSYARLLREEGWL